jgi:hypothetical protein
VPRRGRHRTSLPTRLIAIVAALLVTCGVAVAAGSAFADSDSEGGSDSSGVLSSLMGDESDSGSDSGSSDEASSDDSGSGGDNENADAEGSGDQQDNADDQGNAEDQNGDNGGNGDGQGDGNGDQGNGDQGNGDQGNGDNGDEGNGGDNGGGQAQAAVDNKGRDQIAPAGADQYVDINDVEDNGGNLGDGGRFSGQGSYSVDCGVSDHNNSDNYMAAPGKDNGAQHVHDYVGNESTNANSTDDSLEQAGTSCRNGDQSTFFWPVLRDLNGQGDDVGQDGGSLDGNVGRILQPRSAELTFRGHGDEPVRPMPTHLMMIMGNAKAGQQNGDNVNAKYTCSGHENQVTDKYPVCGQGSRLIRLLDYPSCWDGQNLESANFRDHMAFPDESGNCSDGFVPIPALRIKLTYDQPAGRAFSIDSFPQEQHAANTDHSDFENLASQDSNDEGARCINEGRQCQNLQQ